MNGSRLTIDRLTLRLRGLPEPQARDLAKRIGPALEARLGDLTVSASEGRRRVARVDAGSVPAGRGAGGAADAVAAAISARVGPASPGRGGR